MNIIKVEFFKEDVLGAEFVSILFGPRAKLSVVRNLDWNPSWGGRASSLT